MILDWTSIFVVIAGVVIGATQWLVLRRQIQKAGWWVLASAVGWAVGLIEGMAVGEAIGGAASDAVVGAMVGAVIGVAQWLVLRRQVRKAGWWVPASAIGLGAGVTVATATDADITFGAVNGAVTGIALIWLLRNPLSSET